MENADITDKIDALYNSTGASSHGIINSKLPKNVLLVEDDRAHVQLIMRAMSSLMLDVTHVDTVPGALEFLSRHPVDFVLTDLNLVSSSGFDLIRQIENKFPLLPTVVLTSSANIDDAVRAMRDGAWDYISKNFSSSFGDHLELVIRRTWARALQKVREEEARTERDAFWLASCLAEDGLAILDTQGSLLFKNSTFERFLRILSFDSLNGDIANADLVALVARHDFDLSQQLFSQIHVNDDSLWRSQLEIKSIDNCTDNKNNGDGSSINDMASNRTAVTHYFDLRLSTVIPHLNQRIASDDLENYDINSSPVRYHILWVRDATQIKRSMELERNILATTTHDLKGPLGAIITSTEMILEDSQENFVSEMVLRIASCARTSISLVDQLLSARRLQDGLMKIDPQWEDLKPIAEEVFYEVSPVAQAKGISLVFVKPDAALPIYADELALKRILGNLLGNAIKFTPSGGEVILELESVRDGVVFRVSDNGNGIDAEKQSSLFEMFGRLPEHSKIEGSGLGLYITKQLVDMHKGVLGLKSNPGTGTTFTVRFRNP